MGDEDRIWWGLLRCRCFEFPIVDGVLLLSLAKGYGGPEDDLHPYVPLLVAAVEYLQRGDVEGLRGWIARHLPDLVPLLSDGPTEPYLALSARLGVAVGPLVERYLADVARFEVIGSTPAAPGWRNRLRRKEPGDREVELSRLADYYTTRFFSPRAHALALRLCHLPAAPRVLSLCCGHGVYENLAVALGQGGDIVSIDAQLVNVLITRRYANPGGTFIVHDLQFPLPFSDGHFDGVVSSTCLPEMPSQKSFVSESVRVARRGGWALFDRLWNLEIGARRIERNRHYRFAQNFFNRLEDYVDMFEEVSPGRRVGIDLARPPEAYVEHHGWSFGDEIAPLMDRRDSVELSALVVDDSFPGFTEPGLAARFEAHRLSVSPAYETLHEPGKLTLARRKQVAHLDFEEGGELDTTRFDEPQYLLDRFCHSLVAFVPAKFDSATRPLTPDLSVPG